MSNVRYGIMGLGQPLTSYCELYHSFGDGLEGRPDECKKIRDLGELLIFDAARVGSNVEMKETRDSTIAWVNDSPNGQALDVRRWLIDRVSGIFSMVNRDKFQLDLDDFGPPQYTRYALNQHYDWHVDCDENSSNPAHRKLSIVTMLTGPDEYEGGELELNINGNPEKTLLLRPSAGTTVAFYSHIPHRVRPVLSGNRLSLVSWGLGPKIR